MTKLTQRYPPTPRPYAQAQNLEIGLAELMQQSAGMAATLEGHINGAGSVAGVANPAPHNGAGDYGHDHSGGEFGRPLFRSIATTTFASGGTYNVAPVLQGGGLPDALVVPEAADSLNNTSNGQAGAIIFVPPCDPVAGAYVNLAFVVTLYLQTTDLLSGDTASLRIWRRNPGGNTIRTVAMTLPHITGEKVCVSGASTLLPVQQGAFNRFVFDVRVTRTTGGSARGATFYPHEFELGVYES